MTPSTFAGKGSSYIPEKIRHLVTASLEDKLHSAYGQAATVNGRGQPQVRTVHFRYIKEYGTVGFSTHTKSPKWAHLRRKNALSGCYHDEHRLVQLRWEGSAKLIDPRTASKADQTLLDRMWLLMRPDVRAMYWKDFGAKIFNAKQRCPNLGVVICRPMRWDIFRMHAKDYTKGRRTLYELKGRTWRSRRISVLHGGFIS